MPTHEKATRLERQTEAEIYMDGTIIEDDDLLSSIRRCDEKQRKEYTRKLYQKIIESAKSKIEETK